jgi:hypothetical protein
MTVMFLTILTSIQPVMAALEPAIQPGHDEWRKFGML